MNLQQLEYFLATIDAGSMSAAAERLHLAQPSLSEQIRKLEAELGVSLFRRLGRGVAPTEAAQALRPHAEAVLAGVEHARESVLAQRELRGGIATFGTFGRPQYYLGSALVANFRTRHPNVRVRIVGQNSADVAAEVQAGELEAGIVALPIDDSGLDVRPVMRDEIVYASTDPSRVARPKTFEELGEAPLIISDASYGRDDPTRRQFAEKAQRVGISLEPQIEIEEIEMGVDLVARGLGDMWLARAIILAIGRRIPKRIGWVPFAEPVYDTFAFINRRGATLSPATREFMTLAEARMQAMAAELRANPPRRRAPQP